MTTGRTACCLLLLLAGCTGSGGSAVGTAMHGDGALAGAASVSMTSGGAGGAGVSASRGGMAASSGSGGASVAAGGAPRGVAGAGLGGMVATAGAPASQDLDVGESFPWFTASSGGVVSRDVASDAGETPQMVLTFSAERPRDGVGTHLPQFNFQDQFRGIALRARGSEPLTLRLSLTTEDRASYWDDAEAGLDWAVAEVSVTTEWQSFDVPFDSMQWSDVGEPVPKGTSRGSAIHLFAEHPGDATMWLDDVVLFGR